MNLYSLFRSRFPPDRDAPFLIEPDGGELSYSALDRRTGALAVRLRALGVAPGDRVAIQADKSVAGLLLYLATLRAGAVHLPLNPAYTAPEVRYFLDDSEPALFIGEAEIGEALAGSLAAFKRPKRVLLVDALPHNAMGKVQKNLLRERYCALFEA